MKIRVTLTQTAVRTKTAVVLIDDAFRDLSPADQIDAACAKLDMTSADWVDSPDEPTQVKIEHVK